MSPAVRTLPLSNSPNLHLAHPTEAERRETWILNSGSWSGALSQPDYLEREEHLLQAPLARDGGITHWVLVEKDLLPNRRPLLAFCESLRKRALVARDGKAKDVISHGIGSVFCNPDYRGRGYASRMMRELGERLRTWQAGTKGNTCGFSALWSDIGKIYYAGHGWHPFPSTHIEFQALPASRGGDSIPAEPLVTQDLQTLCERDEAAIRRTLRGAQDGKTQVCIIPDHAQMQWHHAREDFVCQKLFGKKPQIKGAILGEPGHRIWAIWTRNFYGPLESATSENVLHILRLVMEDPEPNGGDVDGPLTNGDGTDEQARKLKAVLQAAQAQAAEWSLAHVELWNPTPLVQALIERANLQHSRVERQRDSIPSLMWYGEGDGRTEDLGWVGNEKFGWC